MLLNNLWNLLLLKYSCGKKTEKEDDWYYRN